MQDRSLGIPFTKSLKTGRIWISPEGKRSQTGELLTAAVCEATETGRG